MLTCLRTTAANIHNSISSWQIGACLESDFSPPWLAKLEKEDSRICWEVIVAKRFAHRQIEIDRPLMRGTSMQVLMSPGWPGLIFVGCLWAITS